jgi:predicted enzyme related to lactoylglutathione lyase
VTVRVTYVNVFVRDLDRALAFYRDALGLELQYAAPEHGYASLAAGPIRLGIGVVGPEQEELVGRHSGVGFEVDDLAAEHRRLVALGVTFPMAPARQPWGATMALVADPDGNVHYLDQAPEPGA